MDKRLLIKAIEILRQSFCLALDEMGVFNALNYWTPDFEFVSMRDTMRVEDMAVLVGVGRETMRKILNKQCGTTQDRPVSLALIPQIVDRVFPDEEEIDES